MRKQYYKLIEILSRQYDTIYTTLNIFRIGRSREVVLYRNSHFFAKEIGKN
jgi:hypothetical protein